MLGCGGDTPSAAPTATPFPQPTGSLAVSTQWLNKIHIGDSYEQVRQAVGKEPRLVSADTLFYDIDDFPDCGCANRLHLTFTGDIDAQGENRDLVVKEISIGAVAVNEHASGEGKKEAMYDHAAALEDYLVELYGQHKMCIRDRFTSSFSIGGPNEIIHYCGSGKRLHSLYGA